MDNTTIDPRYEEIISRLVGEGTTFLSNIKNQPPILSSDWLVRTILSIASELNKVYCEGICDKRGMYGIITVVERDLGCNRETHVFNGPEHAYSSIETMIKQRPDSEILLVTINDVCVYSAVGRDLSNPVRWKDLLHFFA